MLSFTKRIWQTLWIVVGALCVAFALPPAVQAQECPPSNLIVGQQARITEGNANRFRDEPNRNARIISEIAGGTVIRIVDINVCADGVLWARIIHDEKIGWTAEALNGDVFVTPIQPPERAWIIPELSTTLAWSSTGEVAVAFSNGIVLFDSDDAELTTTRQIAELAFDRLVFSPSNPTILAASAGYGVVQIWDIEQASLLYQSVLGSGADMLIEGNLTEIVGFSADGTRLLIQEPEALVILDTASWTETWRYEVSLDLSAFSPDGQWIVWTNYGDFNAPLTLLNVNDEQVRQAPRLPNQSTIFSLRFSPDGQTIVASDNKGALQSWSLETLENRLLYQLPILYTDSIYLFVNDLHYSADGALLLAGTGKYPPTPGTAELWLFNDNQALRWRPSDTFEQVRQILFSSDGTQLLILADSTLLIRSLDELLLNATPAESQASLPSATPTPVQSLEQAGTDGACGLPSRLFVGQFAFVNSSTPNRLRDQASTSGAQIGQVFNDQNLTLLEGPVCNGGFTWWRVDYKGQVGWTIESTSDTYVLDGVAATPTPVPSLTPVPSATPLPSATPTPAPRSFNMARALAWSADRQELAVLDADGLYLFSRATGIWQTTPRFVPLVGDMIYRDLLALADGRWMVLGEEKLFEISAEGEQGIVIKHGIGLPFTESRYQMTASADGTRVLVSSENAYEVYDTSTWSRLMRNDAIGFASAALSPDGQSVALTMGGNDYVELLDVTSDFGRQKLERENRRGQANALLFSPDGEHVALADVQGNIQTWDIATGERVSFIRGEGFSASRSVNALTYSPDGRYLVSAESNTQGIVRVYDAASMRQVYAYGTDSGTISVADVAYDGVASTLAALIDERVVLLDVGTYTAGFELYAAPAP